MKENGWRRRLTGAMNGVLGIITTVAGIVATLGVVYLIVWIISAIAT